MEKDVILGIVRHLLTGAGGVLITEGYVSSTDWATVSGAIVIVAGMAWSYWQKRQAANTLITAVNTPAPAQPITTIAAAKEITHQ